MSSRPLPNVHAGRANRQLTTTFMRTRQQKLQNPSARAPSRGAALTARTRAPRAAAAADRKPSLSDAFPIVGIGASAGGLEAVTQLLQNLPAMPGLAFVLVQHLDPTHESALSSL